MSNPMHPKLSRLFICLTLLLPGGCGLDYYLDLAGGAVGSLLRSRPIAWALADPNVSEATKEKLRFVLEVRQFGIDRIGLVAGPAYTLYDDDTGVSNGLVGYALSASQRDQFVAYTWHFPFVGETEYRGFFSREEAERERAALDADGYDTYLGVIAGFSTLGLLPDPIRASQLRLDDFDLAQLILHELTHTTLFKPGDTTYNETLAQFIGRNAARRFFRERRGENAPETLAALARYDDEDLIDDYLQTVIDELQAVYDLPLSKQEKLARRVEVFAEVTARFETDYRARLNEPDRYISFAELPLNNALLQASARYRGNLPIYYAVLDRLDGDFPAALEVFSEAARHDDSFAFLHDWLAAGL
jgi:predicted aminopeptidase